MSRILKYLLLGILLVPLTIVTHELGHFFAYHLFGAGNVQLHSVSVSANKETLSNFQLAIVNILGPLITYATIALAFFLTRKNYHPLWTIAALAAPIGRIVNFIYIYFRLAGYQPNPNFDEFNFSRNLGIEPLFLAVPTAILVIATFIVFIKKAWNEDKLREVGLIAVSLIAGLVVWSLIGKFIFP
ncbi:MAG: hypothetical protein LUM44_18580 [Pyrinomonadaceae bacterium]|nr:hypothetical protein [Pyrinomonadaceae bacterium]